MGAISVHVAVPQRIIICRQDEEGVITMGRTPPRDEAGMIMSDVTRLRHGGGMPSNPITPHREMGGIDRINATTRLLVGVDGNDLDKAALNMARVGTSLVNKEMIFIERESASITLISPAIRRMMVEGMIICEKNDGVRGIAPAVPLLRIVMCSGKDPGPRSQLARQDLSRDLPPLRVRARALLPVCVHSRALTVVRLLARDQFRDPDPSLVHLADQSRADTLQYHRV